MGFLDAVQARRTGVGVEETSMDGKTLVEVCGGVLMGYIQHAVRCYLLMQHASSPNIHTTISQSPSSNH